MIKILGVRPKGIYVDIEFNLEALKKLVLFLSASEVKYNSVEEPELAEAVEYIVEDTYPYLKKFIEEIEKEHGS